jgi:hypothetical protein
MTALVEDRRVQEIEGKSRRVPVKALAEIHQGALVVQEAGFAVPGRTAAGLVTLGIADRACIGGAANGDEHVTVRRGCFKFANAAGADAVTGAERGADVFVLDDQTVTKTAAGRSVAGRCFDVVSDGVWVEIR